MNQQKILQEVKQLKMFAEMLIDKATRLELGLSSVVLDKPPRKGLSQEAIDKAILKRAKNRLKS